jgi:hypothetical protein
MIELFDGFLIDLLFCECRMILIDVIIYRLLVGVKLERSYHSKSRCEENLLLI